MNRREAERAPSGFGVAEVTIEHDVIGELGLDAIPFSGRILMGLSDRGGEAPYPRTKLVMPDGRVYNLQRSIEKLEALGLVEGFMPGVLTASLDFSRALLRLTDKGRNVVAEMQQTRYKVGPVRSISVEQAIEDGKKILQT
jgi:hypothetical protein